MIQKQSFMLDITWASLFRVGAAVGAVAAIFHFGNFLWWLWASVVVATLANAPVNFFERYRVPRLIGAILVYVAVIAFLVTLAALFIPPFVSEVKQFTDFLPETFKELVPRLPLQILEGEAFTLETVLASQDIGAIVGELVSFTLKLFGGFAAFAFIISIALFLSLERRSVEKFIEAVVPFNLRETAVSVWRRGEKRIVGWFGTRVIGALFIGIITLLGLLLLGAPYPFLFGILAALFDFIPFVGPVLIGVIMVAVAAIESLLLGGLVGILVIVSQQIESNIILPLISKKMIGMHPIYALVIVLVGFKLGGTLGMILSLPLGTVILEAFKEFDSIRNNQSETRQ